MSFYFDSDEDEQKFIAKAMRAHRAVTYARSQRVSLQTFIRMLTRNPKIKLEFTGGQPRTDGNTVWLRVPVEWGDEIEHDRALCSVRDEYMVQQCAACRAHEDVFITTIHECAHIVHGTFESVDNYDRTTLLANAILVECDGNPLSTRAGKIAELVKEHGNTDSYMVLARIVSPWLGLILNAGEDTRVNTLMREARPGTHTMFQAQTSAIFERGILRPDGTIFKWGDAPLNSQAVIAIYCETSGLDYSTWLHPQLVADMADPEVQRLCARMATARNVKGVFRLGFPLLEAMRRLGYFVTSDDAEDDEPPQGDPGQQGQPSDQGEEGESQKGQSDSSDEGESSGSDEDQQESGGGGQDDADESNETESDTGDGGDTDDENADGDDDDADGSGAGDDADDEDDESNGAAADDGDSDDADDAEDGDGQEEPQDGPGADDPQDGPGADAGQDGPQGPNGAPGADDPAPRQNPDGDPDDAERMLAQFARHGDDERHDPNPQNFDNDVDVANEDEDEDDMPSNENIVERMVNQAEHFDKPSVQMEGLKVVTADEPYGSFRYVQEQTDTLKIPRSIIGPALQRMRIVFSDNQKGKHDRNLERGRIDGRVLGRRVPVEDPRLFHKKTQPKKKDYFVTVGLDVSSSTSGQYGPMRGKTPPIQTIKAAAYAKAELLHLLGVRFAVYAHTGSSRHIEMYEVKGPNEPWSDVQRRRLSALQPSGGNYDGHTLEFYRKITERQRATEKVIMYYTDGELNDIGEEFDIFTDNVRICQRQAITVVGVEIGTEAGFTEKVGLDSIRLDGVEDVPRVVDYLRKRLH